MPYNGTLNVYFPCGLKDNHEIRRIQRMWDDFMQCHRDGLRMMHNPNTDQMDLAVLRKQKEGILKVYQAIWADRFHLELPQNDDLGCYATAELANEYRHPREDNLFVKSTSLLLSSFNFQYDGLTEKNAIIGGRLFFSVNIDNSVATVILVLNFWNLNTDDIIILKHLFYKRCKVTICEGSTTQAVNTFQEYVTSKLRPIYPYLKTDIDCRARYMMLEISKADAREQNTYQHASMLYGMLTCDEGWSYANNVNNKLGRDYSPRKSYQLFYNGKNVLIVNFPRRFSAYIKEKQETWKRLTCPEKHIESARFYESSNIAGVDKQLFAKYLKTVEIDYLINDAITSEVSRKISKSIFNPIALIRRLLKSWKILNELDLNIYHIDKDMHRSFGILSNLANIRQEYSYIVGVLTNYFIILVALLTLLATL